MTLPIAKLRAPLARSLYHTRLWHRFFKPNTETRHWVALIEHIQKWYEGKEKFVFPFPAESEKETRYDHLQNALLTFISAELKNATYLRDLNLSSDSFAGLKVADVGSGPFPTLLVFQNCERYCIDPLLDTYRWFGFPLDHFEPHVRFVNAPAERMPFPDGFFDVIVSRDALDHVTDFHEASQEILRVLKPGGQVHVLLNYHEPTASEPLEINDAQVAQEFSRLGLQPCKRWPGAWGFPAGMTVLWSNRNLGSTSHIFSNNP
jgi:SAM-dependent methyltransferase